VFEEVEVAEHSFVGDTTTSMLVEVVFEVVESAPLTLA
jgi:hypothetical protein